jgi:hypothetical protein
VKLKATTELLNSEELAGAETATAGAIVSTVKFLERLVPLATPLQLAYHVWLPSDRLLTVNAAGVLFAVEELVRLSAPSM